MSKYSDNETENKQLNNDYRNPKHTCNENSSIGRPDELKHSLIRGEDQLKNNKSND